MGAADQRMHLPEPETLLNPSGPQAEFSDEANAPTPYGVGALRGDCWDQPATRESARSCCALATAAMSRWITPYDQPRRR